MNDADTAAKVALQGRPVAFDVTVSRADGEPVWRRLACETVTAILQLRMIAAGESLDFGWPGTSGAIAVRRCPLESMW